MTLTVSIGVFYKFEGNFPVFWELVFILFYLNKQLINYF